VDNQKILDGFIGTLLPWNCGQAATSIGEKSAATHITVLILVK
jgi:hypothetical protein